MAKPFPQDVIWDLQPSGAFHSFEAGPLQARVYERQGHIELVGANRAGAAQGNLVRIAPPTAQTQDGVLSIGATTSSQALANGLALRQQLGTHEIATRLTFPHDGVMRYEVTDRGGANPVATAPAVPRGATSMYTVSANVSSPSTSRAGRSGRSRPTSPP